MKSLVLPVVAACALVLSSCGDSTPARSEVVAGATHEIVPARFNGLASLADAVVDGVETWCGGGGPDEATTALTAARSAWAGLQPYRFGPANDRRSLFIIDPNVREEDVEALAESGDVDPVALREFAGADQRGWGAVEQLVAVDPTDQRCAYATGAAQLTADEIEGIATDWVSYVDEISADEAAANIALRNIVSESLFVTRMVRDEPDPALDPARLEGVRLAILGDGTEGAGLTALLSDEVTNQLTADLDASDAQAAEITISTGVTGELGVTVNFSDADGDG